MLEHRCMICQNLDPLKSAKWFMLSGSSLPCALSLFNWAEIQMSSCSFLSICRWVKFLSEIRFCSKCLTAFSYEILYGRGMKGQNIVLNKKVVEVDALGFFTSGEKETSHDLQEVSPSTLLWYASRFYFEVIDAKPVVKVWKVLKNILCYSRILNVLASDYIIQSLSCIW